MRFQTLFLAATLVASSTSAFAAPFSKLVVFGDSVSDNGNLYLLTGGAVPAPPYLPGHASNGLVAAEYLSLALGLGPLVPAIVGGTNFAVIGAATGNVPLLGGGTADNVAATLDDLPPGLVLPATGMRTAQLGQFFLMNPGLIDPDALFLIWGGPNDLVIHPSEDVAEAAAANIGMMVDMLHGAGARHFLVPNMANLALTPGIAGSPLAPLVSHLSNHFNHELSVQLDARAGLEDISITRFSTFDFFKTVVASPGTYGFTDVNSACYTGSILGLGPDDEFCTTSDSHLFWDQSHPTTAAHALLGEAFADAVQPDAVPEPASMALTGLGLGIASLLVRRRRAA